jgi:AraC-like DNA-binding protein
MEAPAGIYIVCLTKKHMVARRGDAMLSFPEMKTGDFAQYSRVFGLDGLEILSAQWVAHSFAPHMHDFYAVSLNYGGRGAFDCRRELRDAAPGTCNLIAPGELHTGHATSGHGWIYRNLHIETHLMTMLLQSLDWQGPLDVRFKFPLVRDTTLATRLAQVFASLAESNSLLQNESVLLSVVARLATDHLVPGHSLRDAGPEHVAVRRVKDWLEAHPEQNVSVHSLADVAGLSPYYLVRVFHKHVGIPPHQYQRNLRVLRARKLLKAGEPISEVAYRTGFCDQSHLNRCFRAVLGVTPGKYSGYMPTEPISGFPFSQT